MKITMGSKSVCPRFSFPILFLILSSVSQLSFVQGSGMKCPKRPNERMPNTATDEQKENFANQAEYFCEKFNMNMDGKNDSEKQECVQKMKVYFENVFETTESIDKFVSTCLSITDNKSMEKCIEVILDLQDACFNMDSASQLIIYYIGPKSLEAIGGSNMITFLMKATGTTTPDDFYERDCLPLFRGPDAALTSNIYGDSGQINTVEIDIFKHYKEWSNSKPDQKLTCTCSQILYIPLVYESRKKVDASADLDNYYNEICLKKNKKPKYWKKCHFNQISSSSEPLNEISLKLFLDNGYPFAKAGWCVNYGETSENFQWTFNAIRNLAGLDFTTNSFSDESIQLTSHAIWSNFSPVEFEQFITITKKYNFDTKCRKEILSLAFNIAPLSVRGFSEINIPQIYQRNSKFWVKNHKQIFFKHLDSLSSLFTRSTSQTEAGIEGCPDFITIFKRFKDVIYGSVWSSDWITYILMYTDYNNKSLDNMLNCLDFSLETENIIAKNELLTTSSSSGQKPKPIGVTYGLQFNLFRNNLFWKNDTDTNVICKNEDENYNLKSNDKIFNMMKEFIFVGKDGNNLTELFNNLVPQ